ncbi:MAG: short-chain dehydrogenase/reductase [Paenibacillaceae bacterium]|nr:short-chain dehydrogenase/reductase [Paenibacillaceae bacterium]
MIEAIYGKMQGRTVLLTGAGGGIGYEAARSFASMGARIILAEIHREKGKHAEESINAEFSDKPAFFYAIDLADEVQIHAMAGWVLQNYGVPDVIFNNATITKMGAVDQVEISFWDQSYAVNLKAPLVLTQRFLPLMKERKTGTIAFVSSSGAAPYMGAYEVFKTAQVELSNTLAMELEDSGVFVYTIGPGLVKTETAMKGIEIVAEGMGMTTEEFYKMNGQHILEVEKAGLGFALSAAFPERYHGKEIGCIQVLMDFDVFTDRERDTTPSSQISHDAQQRRENQLISIQNTFHQQFGGWKKMNIFERQWVFRDFKKMMGLSAEQAIDSLRQFRSKLENGGELEQEDRIFFEKLKGYWEHQLQLLRGYEKNKVKLEENTQIIMGWINDIHEFLAD